MNTFNTLRLDVNFPVEDDIFLPINDYLGAEIIPSGFLSLPAIDNGEFFVIKTEGGLFAFWSLEKPFAQSLDFPKRLHTKATLAKVSSPPDDGDYSGYPCHLAIPGKDGKPMTLFDFMKLKLPADNLEYCVCVDEWRQLCSNYSLSLDKLPGNISPELRDHLKKSVDPFVPPVEAETFYELEEIPRSSFDDEYAEIKSYRFLDTMCDYTMRQWMINMAKDVGRQALKDLEPFFDLPEATKRALFDLEKKYRLATMVIGEPTLFSEEYAKIRGDKPLSPPTSNELIESKSLAEYNEVDHIASRAPQANVNHEIFFKPISCPRTGDINLLCNVFDKADKLLPFVSSNLHVLYPLTIEWSQSVFSKFVASDEQFKGFKDVLPMAPELMGRLEPHDLDMLADWQISVRDSDRAVKIMYNTQGGNLFSQIGSDARNGWMNLGFFAECMFEGKPKIMLFKHAYAHDAHFREHVDGVMKTAAEARKKNNQIYETYQLMRERSAFLNWNIQLGSFNSYSKRITRVNFLMLLDEVHHVNRELIFLISRDIASFNAGLVRVGATPTDDLPIVALMDLFFANKAVSHHLISAVNYINVGFSKFSDKKARSQMHYTDNVMVGIDTMSKYDAVQTTGTTLYMDMSFPGQRLRVGGKTWEERINVYTHKLDKRQIVYADYEPQKSTIRADDTVEYPQPPSYVEEKSRIDMLLAKLGEYEWVACIIPLRLVPLYLARMWYILPAPAPAMVSAFTLHGRTPPKNPVTLSNAMDVLNYAHIKIAIMSQLYVNGHVEVRKMFHDQMSYGALSPRFAEWMGLLRARFADDGKPSNLAGRKYMKRIENLTRKDKETQYRQQVKNLTDKTLFNLGVFNEDDVHGVPGYKRESYYEDMEDSE